MIRKLLTLFLLVVLIVTPTIPVQAKSHILEPDNPYARVGWIESFEHVTQQTPYALVYQVSPTTSGCLTYTLGVNGYSLAGLKIWSYAWNINWCYNGSTITSLNKWRTVWTNYGWSFKGEIAENQSGGVNKSSFWHYAQGDLCFIETYTCVAHSYPWVNQTVYGSGSYTGSAGGD